MYKFIAGVFLKGLTVVIPIAVAAYIVVWLIRSAEAAVSGILQYLLPDGYYIPGMGVAVFVVIVFFAGLLMYPWITRQTIGLIDRGFRQVPLFGSIYSPVKDLMKLLSGDIDTQLGRPVMVKVPNTEMETLGFVTRESDNELPPGFIPDNHLVVFVQWSSQVGGYCFIVPKESVRSVDLSVEEGIRWALTAGLSAPSKKGKGKALEQPH